ncbi:MAG: DNA polymerase beta superfamily protein [archaeon]
MSIEKQFKYGKQRSKNLLDKFYKENPNYRKGYYSISGSYIYGFPDKNSDIDLYGFHIVDKDRWVLNNDKPSEQIIINHRKNPSDGYEKWFGEIEFTSYELKKWGKLVLKTNPNILERIFSKDNYILHNIKEMEKLKQTIQENLPLNVHHHYLGMATRNYKKYISSGNLDKYSDRKQSKKILYVLRGLLGGIYVVTRKDIEPNILKLSKNVLNEKQIKTVKNLIQVKKGNKKLEDKIIKNSRNIMKKCWKIIDEDTKRWSLTECFENAQWPDKVNKNEFSKFLDKWMLKVRKNH